MQTLRLFSDIARDRSFSKAAERHGISQSAASQRIGQLEKRLGVTLIDRSVRPLTLTAAGEAFHEGLCDVLRQMDQLEHRVAQMGDQASGTVKVAAIYSAGIDLLDRVRSDFASVCPAVRVELSYNHVDDVYQSVLEHRADLGIVSYPQRWRKVGITPLRDETMVAVCAGDHPLATARRNGVRAADLAAWPLVTFDASLPVGRRIRRYLKEQGVASRIDLVFDNIDTVKSAVASGQRVSILPRRTVRREVAAGTLACLDLAPTLLRPIGVIHRSAHAAAGGGMTDAAQRFLNYLVQHAGAESETTNHQTKEQRGGEPTTQTTMAGASA